MNASEALKIAKESRKNNKTQQNVENDIIAEEMRKKAEELMQHYIPNRILIAAREGSKYTIVTCKDMLDCDCIYWKKRFALVESLKPMLKRMGYKVRTYDPLDIGDSDGIVIKWGFCIVLD